jgi:nucleoside-diphosphate-sugar epimerase
MKQAIVTGATGFIGSVLIYQLINAKIPVIALGRKKWENLSNGRLEKHPLLEYINLPMENIENLVTILEEKDVEIMDQCVFYNLAWGGDTQLSDLDPITQMKNVAWSLSALKLAAKLECSKFVHIGTMEEAFTLKYLDLDHSKDSYYNRHVIYSLAKITSRNAIKAVASGYNLEIMFASNSHVMGPNDNKDSFLQVTLLKLISKEPLIFSTGEQMFDVISVSDCARGYFEIGKRGKHGAEYWVGSGAARPLKEYVKIMYDLYPSSEILQFGKMPYNDISLSREDFSVESLSSDTGFNAKQSYEDTVIELYDWLVYGVDPTRRYLD